MNDRQLKKYSVLSFIGVIVLIMINLFFYNEDYFSPYLTRGYVGLAIKILLLIVYALCLYTTFKVVKYYFKKRQAIDLHFLLVCPFIIYFLRSIWLICKLLIDL